MNPSKIYHPVLVSLIIKCTPVTKDEIKKKSRQVSAGFLTFETFETDCTKSAPYQGDVRVLINVSTLGDGVHSIPTLLALRVVHSVPLLLKT